MPDMLLQLVIDVPTLKLPDVAQANVGYASLVVGAPSLIIPKSDNF